MIYVLWSRHWLDRLSQQNRVKPCLQSLLWQTGQRMGLCSQETSSHFYFQLLKQTFRHHWISKGVLIGNRGLCNFP
jgi:hypothetical protein